MAPTPTREQLEQARDDAEQAVAGRPRARLIEPLARIHRWLGEDEQSDRRFREAAADVEAVLDRHPEREDVSRMALVASLLWLAGDADAARPWIERALRGGIGPNVGAALHYLAGDDERAAAVAREAAEDPDDRPNAWAEALEDVAIARRDGDAGRAGRARDAYAGMLRTASTPLQEESGSAGLSLSDWYAECSRLEAELRGEPPPDRAALLARLAG